MQQLNAHDAMFVHFDNDRWACHGGMVGIYDPSTAPGGQVRFRDILAHLQRRLPRSPIFRRRLVRVPLDFDHPYWIEDETFDLESHVHHLRLPAPADWRQLCITVARLDSYPLDMNRPLWEMYVIEGLDHVDGVPAGSYAIFTKLHHAAVDGHSMRDILTGIHDLTPEVDESEPDDQWRPEHHPSAAALLGRAALNNLVAAPLRTARAAATLLPAAPQLSRALRARGGDGSVTLPFAPPRVPHTRFQAEVTPHRVLDSRAFPLDDIARLRALVDGATVNDVIIAIVGGAVRRYLAAKGETPTDELICGAPVDLRADTASTGGNDIAFLTVALGADVDDPVKRLRHIRHSTGEAKHMQKAIGARELSEFSASFPGALSSWGFKALAASQLMFGRRRPMANVGVSNVPGPQVPLYMNGARADRFFGVAPIFHGSALVVGVFSYCGRIEVTFVSCRRVVPDPAFFAECLQSSYDEFGTAGSANTARRSAGKTRRLKALTDV
ncbi:MAG: wax ester/triacylglycerol synthase family O-acyltransferase, partial [Mycobacterium sp.]|nr:wax ester/triacylglycerol synthase family O-acyltransferase [Mycobacterium sp.]